jgi:DNA-binding CsgD family transcriptional regulator
VAGLLWARLQLSDAIDTFQRLGARPWATRAVNELRAAGLATAPSGTPGAAALTAQEGQIAVLAASGLSNKQIADRVFLSPRTVQAHLYHVFLKLGITSRAALRDALAAVPDPADPGLKTDHGLP